MASPKQVLKSVGPKLVPFFKTVAIYFVLFIPKDQPSIFAAVIKMLPILSLIAFVLLHGMSLGEEYQYSRRIMLGLVFSSVGDAFLVWPDCFLYGMAAFGVAQCFYVSAYGFKPFKLSIAVVLYSTSFAALTVLMPKLSGALVIGMPIYSFLLTTMAWRAMARVQFFEDLWTWTKLCSCVGALLFLLSDAVIGFSFFHTHVPYDQVIIMVTYYAAQLGISLSVVDSKASYLDARSKEQEERQQQLLLQKEEEEKKQTASVGGATRRHVAFSQ